MMSSSASLTNRPAHGPDDEACIRPDGVEDREPLATADDHVVGAEGGCEVDDASPVGRRDELCRDDAVACPVGE
jgi:hypothetical protein